MAGPFPGMDPWLENRVLWQGFHNVYIAQCMIALNRELPPQFVATTELRIQHVGIVSRFAIRPNPIPQSERPIAVADPTTVEPLVIRSLPQEEHQAFITIRDVFQQDRVVTVIELLSPSNKRGRGYEEYRTKQTELLLSETNLIEIDLLRAGEHTVALPVSDLIDRGAVWDYLVCLHDVTARWSYRVWPLLLTHRLPEIPIPLGAGYAPVVLDLQALLNECYDTGRYGSLLRYNLPPEVPLSEEQMEWANTVLTAASG